MNPNSQFADSAGAGPNRRNRRRSLIPRYAALIVAICASTGCERDVTLNNPRSGATEVCRESLRGLNPWSQTMSCVADQVAQGWTRPDRR